jgi:hypothetical protein
MASAFHWGSRLAAALTSAAADREMNQATLGLRAPVSIGRHIDAAH